MSKEIVVRTTLDDDFERAMNPGQGVAVREARRELGPWDSLIGFGNSIATFFGGFLAVNVFIYIHTAKILSLLFFVTHPVVLLLIAITVISVGCIFLGNYLNDLHAMCNADIYCIDENDCNLGCIEGMLWDADKKKCCKCPEGEYNTLTHSRLMHQTCKKCPENTYAPSLGNGKCHPCRDGKRSQPGATKCVVNTCQISEEMCGDGFDDNWFWSDDCDHCPKGRSLNSDGACCPCAPGKYQAKNAYSGDICHNCPPGKYQPNFLEDECLICERGKYALKPGSDECRIAEKGRYVAESDDYTNLIISVACPAGRYADEEGATDCIDCPTGKFLAINQTHPTPSDSLASCSSCPSGTSSNAGSEFCTTCASGSYAASPSSTHCSLCPEGKFISDNSTLIEKHDKLSDCVNCIGGKTSTSGASECFTCSPGKYSQAGFHMCVDCPFGTTLPDQGDNHEGERDTPKTLSNSFPQTLFSPLPSS
jgi:hypothetical protein